MSRKIARGSLVLTVVSMFAAGSLLFTASPLLADEGRSVTATPFDHKLAAAGLNLSLTGASGSSTENAETLFRVCRSFRYVKDQGGDKWQSAEETDRRHSGDCEDKAIWMFYRLKMAGYQDVRLVIGRYKRHQKQLHVWVQYRDEVGNLCLADPTLQKRIWCLSDFAGDFYSALFSFDGKNRYLHSS